MRIRAIQPPRFGLKQLFAAFVIVAICLMAYLLVAQWKQRVLVVDIYGSYEVYQRLRDSDHFELFRVKSSERIDPAITDWDIPAASATKSCGHIVQRDNRRLHELLGSPQNFNVNFVKDFMFGPTFLLSTANDQHRLDIFFDFEAKMAAIVLFGQCVQWLITDNVAAELEKLLSRTCADRPNEVGD